MRKAYHYTSRKNYYDMVRGGFLRALSPILDFGTELNKSLMVPEGKFLFCLIDSPEPEGWKEFGGLAKLFESISIDKQSRELMLLSFNLTQSDKAYVLEEAYPFLRNPGRPDYPRNCWRLYLDSMVELHNYDGSYILPVVVVGNDIDIRRVSLERAVEV